MSIATTEPSPGVSVERERLYRRYAHRLVVNPDLTRTLVSFQANKRTPFYRWLKYREAFSAELVRYVLERLRHPVGRAPAVLDPFAGVGTVLTVAARAGWQATGIELLPVGLAAMRARLVAERVDRTAFLEHVHRLSQTALDAPAPAFPHLRITLGAFPAATERALAAYRHFLSAIDDPDVRYLFWFAGLAVLEEVSYTRKDGQYLRWDVRSGRGAGSRFHKGEIPDFKTAVLRQLAMMAEDLGRRDGPPLAGRIRVVPGSCLIELMSLADDAFDLVMTSPPYCNRYDYTRTYALELAYMGYDDADVKRLRQSLLSCTVENRGKHDRLRAAYAEKGLEARYRSALEAFSQQAALQEVLRLLYTARGAGSLNNDHIPAMVENYFFEMCLVVRELARVLAPGGHVVMVNDNVQYHGQEIPVDLILSDFAAQAGLEVDCIWVLPRGKGNSSQQMGAFGRRELRKCVYVWSKPALE